MTSHITPPDPTPSDPISLADLDGARVDPSEMDGGERPSAIRPAEAPRWEFLEPLGLSAEELVAYSRARLAAHRAPKNVRFIDEIPKSAVGRPLRRAVRDPCWAWRERRV
jgi:acyl-CoA synthetase (AMP-forming)/AMP-acid ligase II